MTVTDLILSCQRGESKGQRKLFDRFVDVCLNVSKRYVTDDDLAKEAVIRGFAKLFEKIATTYEHRGEKTFEGWLMRIMVNESLMLLRERKRITVQSDYESVDASIDSEAFNKMEAEYIYEALSTLPSGYRVIISLYAIEGYSHKEIADQLGISEGTSRSQLMHARRKLQTVLNQYNGTAI